MSRFKSYAMSIIRLPHPLLALLPLVAIPTAVAAQAPVPVEAAAARWAAPAARDLLSAIEAADREGLTPADYDPATLRRAIDAGPGPALDMAADTSARALAQDYLFGRVKDRAAFDWHIERSAYDGQALNAGLAKAMAEGQVGPWLRSLLPADPQYVALRAALADATDADEVALIRANMERWRWMPRRLGAAYLYVNLPTYRLRVMRDGVEASSYTVVVGAPKTPTPQLAVAAERVVVNPWWTLPPSVLAEGKRYSPAKGYVYARAASGRMMVRQRPGPANALGRIKIDMPNDHAIYLHDTPSKAAFARKDRALSHGCIRVQGIDELANELEGDGRVDEALAGEATTTIALGQAMPVYIVYLTAEADASGKVSPLVDIYGRDAAMLAALDGGAAKRLGGRAQVAAR